MRLASGSVVLNDRWPHGHQTWGYKSEGNGCYCIRGPCIRGCNAVPTKLGNRSPYHVACNLPDKHGRIRCSIVAAEQQHETKVQQHGRQQQQQQARALLTDDEGFRIRILSYVKVTVSLCLLPFLKRRTHGKKKKEKKASFQYYNTYEHRCIAAGGTARSMPRVRRARAKSGTRLTAGTFLQVRQNRSGYNRNVAACEQRSPLWCRKKRASVEPDMHHAMYTYPQCLTLGGGGGRERRYLGETSLAACSLRCAKSNQS